MRSYAERMTGLLRSLWNAPSASPPPPRRVWRDWLLVSLAALLAVFESLVRADLSAPLVSAIVVLATLPTLLWRRTHPFAMLAIALVITVIAARVLPESEQLVTGAVFLVLPYALFRWGSGRAIALGVGVILVSIGVSAAFGTTLVDMLTELTVTVIVAAIALGIRSRASSSLRAIDRVKLLEREQLARDLHDTVAHHVSAIAIRAQAGLAAAAQNPDAATDALAIIEVEASKTLAEMRSMVRVLRHDDTPLAPNPRVGDIRQLADSDHGGPTVDVAISGETDSIPPTVAAAIYRLAQESITNARRHARNATRIDVRVDAQADAVQLTVRDDGDTTGSAAPGYGITGMIERAALLGGTCTAGRAPGRGWVVTAVLPRAGWST